MYSVTSPNVCDTWTQLEHLEIFGAGNKNLHELLRLPSISWRRTSKFWEQKVQQLQYNVFISQTTYEVLYVWPFISCKSLVRPNYLAYFNSYSIIGFWSKIVKYENLRFKNIKRYISEITSYWILMNKFQFSSSKLSALQLP